MNRKRFGPNPNEAPVNSNDTRVLSWPARVFAAAAAIACFCLPVPATAQDYSVYGTVTAAAKTTWHDGASPETTFSVPLDAAFTHSVAGDTFDLTARTTLASSGDDATAVSISVPELSLSAYPASWLTTRAGRFDLDWGTGYIFSPGDALAGRADAAASVTGISVSVIPGFSTIGATVSLPGPEPTVGANPLDELIAALWADGYTGGVDWFAGLQYQSDVLFRPSIGVSIDIAGTIVAAEGALEIAERYTYPTASLAFEPRPEPLPLASVALQRSFGGSHVSASVTAEYLYDGLGYTQQEADRIYALVASGAIDPVDGDGPVGPSLGRHYLAGELSFEWIDAAGISVSGITNVTDRSFTGTAELTVRALAAIDFFLRSTMVWGESFRSEFAITGTSVVTVLGTRVNL